MHIGQGEPGLNDLEHLTYLNQGQLTYILDGLLLSACSESSPLPKKSSKTDQRVARPPEDPVARVIVQDAHNHGPRSTPACKVIDVVIDG